MSDFSVKIVLTIFDVISFARKSTYAHSDWSNLECTPISDVLSNGFAKLPILGSVCTETRGPNVGLSVCFCGVVRVFARVFSLSFRFCLLISFTFLFSLVQPLCCVAVCVICNTFVREFVHVFLTWVCF